MAKLGKLTVGIKDKPTIMGIINISPESFYKNSIKTSKSKISQTVRQMEDDGAQIVDIGGMSTAPYLKTTVSEKQESDRITKTVKIIQNISNLPISVDTCRAKVAQDALENGVEIINDVSGLKYDKNMPKTIEKFQPSLILCAYSKKAVGTRHVTETKRLLQESIKIAKRVNISKNRIIVDPAIGFFRNSGTGFPFTKMKSDWADRDVAVLRNLSSIKNGFPLLVSVSNKSFIGKLTGKTDPRDRLHGSLAAEFFSVINGADILRTHNVSATKDILSIYKKLLRNNKKGL
ncbi:MAG: dihydropteroate synthase [Candidatus Nitrosopelagicus sp.]|jgi:dihydropteroate synthase|nr:dihydropteroate synthase [Candidatus Nitrosopelagicus sp.]